MTSSERSRLIDSPRRELGETFHSDTERARASDGSRVGQNGPHNTNTRGGNGIKDLATGITEHDDETEIDIDDAIDSIGMGRFQWQILLAAGLCYAADGIELLLLTFVGIVLSDQWGLTENEMDTMISIVFIGALFGTLCLGPLADRVGRRPLLVTTATIIALFGILTAFVQTIEWFYIVRFVVGFGVGGLTIPYDTLAEFVPTAHRGTNILNIEYFWTAGTMLTPVLAKWTIGKGGDDSWRWFVVACAVPCILAAISSVAFVPESPRWLLTQGRHEEAAVIFRQAAYTNGKDGMLLFPAGTQIKQSPQAESRGDACATLLSPKWCMVMLKLSCAWLLFTFLFYGDILMVTLVFSKLRFPQSDSNSNETSDSYDFDYDAIFISATSELLGLLFLTSIIDTIGRKPSQIISYVLGGTLCLSLGFLNESGTAPRGLLLLCACLSRFFVNGGNCASWVFTSELLTTEIRSTGHSTVNAMARIGAFFSPYVITPSTSSSNIGLIMFAICIVTSCIVSQLPETNGKALGVALGETAESDAMNRVVDDVKESVRCFDDEPDDEHAGPRTKNTCL